MGATVVLILVLLSPASEVYPAAPGGVGTAYFTHMDLCKAAADDLTKQVKSAGGQMVASCQFTSGAATR
jgi:hypothetical protein